MEKYEYNIMHISTESLGGADFTCTEDGLCGAKAGDDELRRELVGILNRSGEDGWELVQFAFGRHGVVAFLKRGMPLGE